jgi:hypothetical protein
MQNRLFGDREKAMEEAFFRSEDAKLLKSLQQKAHLDEIATALGEQLQVKNPDLLLRVRQLGITLETAAGFFLAPLVQVAWANGKVSKKEHDTVLRIALRRGIEADSPAYAKLEEWLGTRPSDSFFDTAVELLAYGFSVLPADEKEERIKTLLDACHEVAEGEGTHVGFVMGMKNVIGLSEPTDSQAAAIEAIGRSLRRPVRPS